ncbi:MAG: ATP synthase F1 subunit delta [Chitinophagaceae bacterium]|nr:ATP synthase F1 subunit delta [Chitinophagaceae bacterium]
MNNPRLAIRYAKSLIDLATERNQLDEVNNEMKFLQAVCKGNPDFTAVLRSPIIPEDKKNKIIESITKGRVGELTGAFIKLLGVKNRESNLPEIITSFIAQYNQVKGIHKVKITTAEAMSEEMKEAFIEKIQSAEDTKNIELETAVNEKLIGGFVLEMEGKLVDTSIQRDLRDIKKQFMNNDYLHRLR